MLVGERLPGLESVAVAFHSPAGAVHDPAGPLRTGDALGRDDASAARAAATAARWSRISSRPGCSGRRPCRAATRVSPARWSPASCPWPCRSTPTSSAGRCCRPTSSARPADGAPEPRGHRGRPGPPRDRRRCGGSTAPPVGHADRGHLRRRRRRSASTTSARSSRRTCSPAGMIVAVAGRIDWDDFVRRIETLLGDWQPGAAVRPANRAARPDASATCRTTPSRRTSPWPGRCPPTATTPPTRPPRPSPSSAAARVRGCSPRSASGAGLCYSVSAGYQTSRDFADADLLLRHDRPTGPRRRST